MTRCLTLLIAMLATGCAEIVEVSVTRPSTPPQRSVEPRSPRFAGAQYPGSPPATVSTVPCATSGRGRVCGKVSWTDTCVTHDVRPIVLDTQRITQPPVPL